MSTDKPASPEEKSEAATNVLLIVDAETVLSHYPEPSQAPDEPTPIGDGFIFALGGAHLMSDGNSRHLKLRADNGQTFHIRSRDIALLAEHSVVFYQLIAGDTGVLSTPQLIVNSDQRQPVLNKEDLTQPISQNADDHFWQCRPLAAGIGSCELRFMLVDSECKVLGYYSWKADIELVE